MSIYTVTGVFLRNGGSSVICRRREGLVVVLALAGFAGLALLASQLAWAIPYTPGDVFVGAGSGKIKEFTPKGVLVQILDTKTGSSQDTGMAFDASGNLIATAFEANAVVKFDSSGTLLGPFGSGYDSNHPESVIITPSFVLIGQADGVRHLKQFKTDGTFIQDFAPATELRGTDWNDLAADGKTDFYTSEGFHVKRFDISTKTQLADFNAAPLAGANAYALRIIPKGPFAGDVLVADTDRVERLTPAGVVDKEYLVGNSGLLFALNLDPGGTDFWTAGLLSGTVYEINIATGATDNTWSATPFVDVAGLAVFGEICTTCGPKVPEPGTPLLFASALAGLAVLRGFWKGRLV